MRHGPDSSWLVTQMPPSSSSVSGGWGAGDLTQTEVASQLSWNVVVSPSKRVRKDPSRNWRELNAAW